MREGRQSDCNSDAGSLRVLRRRERDEQAVGARRDGGQIARGGDSRRVGRCPNWRWMIGGACAVVRPTNSGALIQSDRPETERMAGRALSFPSMRGASAAT